MEYSYEGDVKSFVPSTGIGFFVDSVSLHLLSLFHFPPHLDSLFLFPFPLPFCPCVTREEKRQGEREKAFSCRSRGKTFDIHEVQSTWRRSEKALSLSVACIPAPASLGGIALLVFSARKVQAVFTGSIWDL